MVSIALRGIFGTTARYFRDELDHSGDKSNDEAWIPVTGECEIKSVQVMKIVDGICRALVGFEITCGAEQPIEPDDAPRSQID